MTRGPSPPAAAGSAASGSGTAGCASASTGTAISLPGYGPSIGSAMMVTPFRWTGAGSVLVGRPGAGTDLGTGECEGAQVRLYLLRLVLADVQPGPYSADAGHVPG